MKAEDVRKFVDFVQHDLDVEIPRDAILSAVLQYVIEEGIDLSWDDKEDWPEEDSPKCDCDKCSFDSEEDRDIPNCCDDEFWG